MKTCSPYLVVVLALFGCRDVGDNGRVGPLPSETEHTIYDVQSEETPVGTAVTLRGVVVVSVDAFGGRQGGMFVAEPEGGPFSGVFVFARDSESGGLEAGDLVDIVGGEKVEFALDSDDSGRKLTQVAARTGGSLTIDRVGSALVPEPVVLKPWELAASDEEAEKWEGVLIRFENVRVLSTPRSVTQSDATLKEMRVTGPFIVQSGLTEFKEIERDVCYSSVTGIGDYFFNYKLQPRSPEDLVKAEDDSLCLPLEQGEEACDDGEDNDRNGFADCDDLKCVETAAHCITDTDVVSIQKNEIEEGTTVRLASVLVVARSLNGKSIWVQDPTAEPGAHNGLYLFSSKGIAPDAIPGVLIKVEGKLDEFDIDSDDDEDEQGDGKLTELKNLNIEILEGAAEARTSLLDLATAITEEFESVLVEIADLKITEVGEKGRIIANDGTTDIQIDQGAFELPAPEVGQCLSLTGIMDYNTFSDPDAPSVIVTVAVPSTGCQ